MMSTLRAEFLLMTTWVVSAGLVGSVAAQPPAPAPPSESETQPAGETTARPAATSDSCRGCNSSVHCQRCGGCRYHGTCSCGFSWFQRMKNRHHYYKDHNYCPPPFGSSVNAVLTVQKDRGVEARMVLYQYDFVEGCAELTPRGEKQLYKMADRLLKHPFAILVEPIPPLAETVLKKAACTRRQAVQPSDRQTDRVLPKVGECGKDETLVCINGEIKKLNQARLEFVRKKLAGVQPGGESRVRLGAPISPGFDDIAAEAVMLRNARILGGFGISGGSDYTTGGVAPADDEGQGGVGGGY